MSNMKFDSKTTAVQSMVLLSSTDCDHEREKLCS